MVAIVDSNADPDNIDYIIPGNDDALRSISLYNNYFTETIIDAKNFQIETDDPKDTDKKTNLKEDNK